MSNKYDYSIIANDKKRNVEYWDDIDNMCYDFADFIIRNFAMIDTPELDEDYFWDISKRIEEVIVNRCADYGVDTDKAFPYVDCDF